MTLVQVLTLVVLDFQVLFKKAFDVQALKRKYMDMFIC